MIQFECPSCFAPLKVPESAAGRKGTCKTCGTSVTVPSPQEEALEIHEWTDDLIAEEDYITPPPRPKNNTSAKSGRRSKNKKRRSVSMDDSTWYRGFWIRLAGYLIDAVILTILWLPISVLMSLSRALFPVETELELLIVNLIFTMSIISMNTAFGWLYYSILHSSPWQATVGKKLLGLAVVDGDGDRISFGRATGRFLAGYLSAAVFGIGYLRIGWSEKHQGLHDVLAGTYVITAD